MNEKKEKERKRNQSKKYGKAAYLQSRRGVISCWLTGWSLAIWNAIEGFEEQDRKYLSCKCGIGIGIVQILCFLGIFVGGLSL